MAESTIPYSEVGQRATVGDPIADIFNMINAAKAANPEFIGLAAGPPPNEVLPNDELVNYITSVQSKFGEGLLNYTRPQGLPPFCEAVAESLKDYGVVCEDPMKNMVILSGGMEGIDYVAQAVLNPGDTVLVESPAFAGAVSDFSVVYGANVIHVKCDEDGIIPAELEKAIAEYRPKLVSLMTSFQNPKGWNMSLGRRKEIAKILLGTGTLAVEDGAYAMLGRPDEPIIPALQSLAPNNVAYVPSLSKSMFPGGRLGAVVGPAELIGVLANIKSLRSMQASGFLQALATMFIGDREKYTAHVAELRTMYAKRCDAMAEALAESLPEASFVMPKGGMFMYVTLPGVDCDALLPVAVNDHGVGFVPGSACYLRDSGMGKNELRLNFASNTEVQCAEGVRRIAAAVKASGNK